MKLDGLHHVTMITGDARSNVDFYAGLLGLRLVKKTVNFDAPDAYHLYFGDEQGSPGTLLTWFEFAGAPPGRAGAGMIHTLQLGVAGEDSLSFWEQRLLAAGYAVEREAGSLGLADYEGLRLELVIARAGNTPLRAAHPEIPPEHAIQGLEGARAYPAGDLQADAELLTQTLGFQETGAGEYLLEGQRRSFAWAYDAPTQYGRQGAGTVHHIAWHCRDEDHAAWRRRVVEAHLQVTPVIDRDYFLSIYFREQQGILFEIATTSPGFAVDEDPEHLGEQLRLPRRYEQLRSQLERQLTPLVNPRALHAHEKGT